MKISKFFVCALDAPNYAHFRQSAWFSLNWRNSCGHAHHSNHVITSWKSTKRRSSVHAVLMRLQEQKKPWAPAEIFPGEGQNHQRLTSRTFLGPTESANNNLRSSLRFRLILQYTANAEGASENLGSFVGQQHTCVWQFSNSMYVKFPHCPLCGRPWTKSQ